MELRRANFGLNCEQHTSSPGPPTSRETDDEGIVAYTFNLNSAAVRIHAT